MNDDGLARHLRQIAPALLSVVFLEIAVSSLVPLVGVQLTMRQTPKCTRRFPIGRRLERKAAIICGCKSAMRGGKPQHW